MRHDPPKFSNAPRWRAPAAASGEFVLFPARTPAAADFFWDLQHDIKPCYTGFPRLEIRGVGRAGTGISARRIRRERAAERNSLKVAGRGPEANSRPAGGRGYSGERRTSRLTAPRPPSK
jgi:hypothetical protein